MIARVGRRDGRCIAIYANAQGWRRKPESYNLSGSVVRINVMGRTLKLPRPSESAADPGGWRRGKSAGVFLAVDGDSSVSLTVARAMSLMLGARAVEVKSEGRYILTFL